MKKLTKVTAATILAVTIAASSMVSCNALAKRGDSTTGADTETKPVEQVEVVESNNSKYSKYKKPKGLTDEDLKIIVDNGLYNQLRRALDLDLTIANYKIYEDSDGKHLGLNFALISNHVPTDNELSDMGMSRSRFEKISGLILVDYVGNIMISAKTDLLDKYTKDELLELKVDDNMYISQKYIVKNDASVNMTDIDKDNKITTSDTNYCGNGIIDVKSQGDKIAIIDKNMDVWVYSKSDKAFGDTYTGRQWIRVAKNASDTAFMSSCMVVINNTGVISTFGDNYGYDYSLPYGKRNNKYKLESSGDTLYVYIQNDNKIYGIGKNIGGILGNTSISNKFIGIDITNFVTDGKNIEDIETCADVQALKIDGSWIIVSGNKSINKTIDNNVTEYIKNTYNSNITDIEMYNSINGKVNINMLSDDGTVFVIDNGYLYKSRKSIANRLLYTDNSSTGSYVITFGSKYEQFLNDVDSYLKFLNKHGDISDSDMSKLYTYDTSMRFISEVAGTAYIIAGEYGAKIDAGKTMEDYQNDIKEVLTDTGKSIYYDVVSINGNKIDNIYDGTMGTGELEYFEYTGDTCYNFYTGDSKVSSIYSALWVERLE